MAHANFISEIDVELDSTETYSNDISTSCPIPNLRTF